MCTLAQFKFTTEDKTVFYIENIFYSCPAWDSVVVPSGCPQGGYMRQSHINVPMVITNKFPLSFT